MGHEERENYLNKLKLEYRLAMLQVANVRIELASRSWSQSLKKTFNDQIACLEWNARTIYERLETIQEVSR